MSPTDQARTSQDAVIEQARTAAQPHPMAVGDIAVFHTPRGIETVDLDGGAYNDRKPRPRRKTGTVTVHDVASFTTYYGKHKDPNTEVYVDLDQGVITAVLDAHEPSMPRWERHRLELRLTPTLPWQRWLAKDRHLLPQVSFAEFLEDNLVDIANEPVTAATMLEVASTFQAATKGSFSSKTNLSSGARTLMYEEDTTATSGTGKQTIPVPDSFAVMLAPFDDVPLYKIKARLRYRIEGSALKLGFFLERPEDSLRDAVKTVVKQVVEASGTSIMRGAPA